MNQISKDFLYGHKLTLFWRSLKSCTHAHTKYDIGLRCAKIKEGSNYGEIYLLIHDFSISIEINMAIGWHGHLDCLGTLHVTLLQHVLGVLGLA